MKRRFGAWETLRRRSAWLGLWLSSASWLGADAPLPPYPELVQLIRTHVSGISEDDLQSAAAGALLAKVRGRVLAPGENAEPLSGEPAIIQREVYDNCGYIRVGQVTLALAPQLAAAMQNPEFTGSRGLILDLRFAVGDDYRAAANVVGLFIPSETTVLTWGEQSGLTPAGTNAWTRPVVILVNHETRGAAEAVAASLRQQRLGLVIGARTAGAGAVFKEVPLDNGSGNRLRLAVSSVKTADGQPLPAEGVTPDIEVKVRPEHERTYISDPFSIIVASPPSGAGGTNTIASNFTMVRKRISEADLVRQKRETVMEAAKLETGPADAVVRPDASTRPATPDVVKIVKDPVLGRALDLLKGLSLLGAKPR